MTRTIRFKLNQELRELTVREESLVLDWLRNEAGLKGTKEACREGDCGACLVLLGGRGPDGTQEWMTATSCTLAMGELDGRHVVTIEGLAAGGLTPVMEALLDEGASQCGFCSPGFVVALTGFLVSGTRMDPVAAMAAVEGNLCRCTGYGSIRRAAELLAARYADLPPALPARLAVLAVRRVLPAGLASAMIEAPEPCGPAAPPADEGAPLDIGGGTDYFVRNPDPQPGMAVRFADASPDARRIRVVGSGEGRMVELGPAFTASDFFASAVVRAAAPGIERFEADVASPPIRNRATLAGNIANASPIADMTAMLIALDAELALAGPAGSARVVPLAGFFKGYKQLDLAPGERIATISFPAAPVLFNFEKAAKRARLDIATANTAMAVRMSADGTVAWVRCSAGGVAPVPLRLTAVEDAIVGRKPSAALAREAGRLAAAAGSPIDDVRGSARYRRSLMERLTWAHCIRLWPDLDLGKELLS